jgi:hypothetical protein
MEPAILARLLHIVVAVEWNSVSVLVNAAQQLCGVSCLESQHLSVAVENSWEMESDLWVCECLG